MEPLQLRDEAVRDRIRLAEEFLDPSKFCRNEYHMDELTLIGDQRARRHVYRL